MRLFYSILFWVLLLSFSKAQDKIIFTDGKSVKGIVISFANDFVFFKKNDTSVSTIKFPKKDVLLIEKYDGSVYLFARNDVKAKDTLRQIFPQRKNYAYFQPYGVFLGRVATSYERLSKDGKIGYVIPLILTFDPVGSLYKENNDSTGFDRKHYAGINFISGADINFYIGQKERIKFYIGPRLRYGVDMFLENTEGYSLQSQFGWKSDKPNSRFVQHLAFGFGFVRVLSISGTNRISPKQSFGWGSVTYKLGFKW